MILALATLNLHSGIWAALKCVAYRCIKTLARHIGNPNSATRTFMNISFFPPSGFSWVWGLGASWILLWNFGGFFKEENQSQQNFADSSPQTSPHTQTTYSLRNFAANFAGKTSPTESRQLFAFDKKIGCPCGHSHRHACSSVWTWQQLNTSENCKDSL